MESTWTMIAEAIDLIDPDTWLDHQHQFSYGQRLYHLIETWEFYIRDSPDGMEWGNLIELPSELTEETWAQEFYVRMDNLTPQLLRDYLIGITEECRTMLGTLSDSDLLNEDGFREWIPNRLIKYIYLIRHTMWHLGELSHYLRSKNMNTINWN